MTDSTRRIVIVGAGISGLAVAYRLRARLPGAHITVLEQADRSGGTTWTLREQGFQVETGPNGFLDTKPATLTLCRDLGLGPQLIQASAAAGKNRYLFHNGRLQMLPGTFGAFLRSNLLSWRGKVSLLLERFRRRRRDGADESIDAFALRRGGREAAAVLADAMVTGIYAGDPKLLSLPACFPRLAEFEREYGSVMTGFAAAARRRRAEAHGGKVERPGKMWSFAGGLRVMIERLHEQVQPITGVSVRAVRRHEEAGRVCWRVEADGRDVWPADAVVLTCPAHQQCALLADLDAGLVAEIGAIPYNRVAVAALGFRRADVPMPLDGFGFIAPEADRRDLLGVQWCSSIYPARCPDDCVLLRALCGGWHRADMLDRSDDQLLASLRAELRLTMNITATPVFHRIVRWDRAIPQYVLGHLDRVARIASHLTRHPGLYLGGNAYHGVALNDCAERGSILAETIANSFS
jgi:oxygen-dependent protoporphyrinogen oxidase